MENLDINNKIVVPDTNIFFKLLQKESDSYDAIELVRYCFHKSIRLIVPEIFITELENGSKKYRRNVIPIEDIDDLIRRHINWNIILPNNEAVKFLTVMRDTQELILQAIEMTGYWNEKSWFPSCSDSMFHMLAVNNKALFVSADRRHLAKITAYKNIKDIGNAIHLNDWRNHPYFVD